MSYLVINDFRFGLDKRRLDLANRPGALSDIVNAHITNGGEIEKRKAFVRTALALTAGGVPVTTYGMTALLDSIEIYGNVPEANIDGGTIPTNFTYKDLRMTVPVSAAGSITYTLTGIHFSTVFGGKAFVIAQMSGGFRALFYDGQLVLDFISGIVRALETDSAGFLRRLGNDISATGLYTATYSLGTGLLSVFGVPGSPYVVTIIKSTAAGTLTESKVAETIPGTLAQVAVGSFKVNAGSVSAGTNKIVQIVVGATNLLNPGNVDFVTGTEQTATALAAAITANSVTSGYRGVAEASLVRIISTTTGTTPNAKVVAVTAAGDVCIGRCSFAFSGTNFTVNSIKANGTLLSAGLSFPQSAGQTLSAFAAVVATDIRNGSGVHGYTALASGSGLYISKLVTSSSDVPITVEVDLSSGTINTGTGVDLSVTTTKTSALFGRGALTSPFVSEVVAVLVTGGTPPYSYLWPTVTNPSVLYLGTPIRIVPTTPKLSTCQYMFVALGGIPLPQGTVPVKCTVTDAIGTVVESDEILFVLPGIGT